MSSAEGTRSRPRWRRRILATLAVSALALALTHELLFSVFVVSGVSMEPTLHEGERVVVVKRFYGISRGDLLVFRNPTAPDLVCVKRVLALPEERIEVREGRVFVDETELEEPYAKPGTRPGDLARVKVPAGCYFLVGDNRGESIDSRRLGPIPGRWVVGKVMLFDD